MSSTPPSLHVREVDRRVVDRHVTVNGLRLHLRESGDARAPVALVLHGIMGHTREWDTLTAALAPRFRVIAVDQRGHGESEWADEYAVAAFAGDLAGLIDALGLGPARVVGHSLGGMAAMLAAAARPELVERVVLLDIGPESIDTPSGREELPAMLAAFAQASYGEADEAVQEWLAGNPLAREELMRHYVGHCLVARADGRLAWRFDAAGLARWAGRLTTPRRLWDAVDRIAAPALVVRGEHSTVLARTDADRMVRRLARGRQVEIAGGGHDLGVEQPEAVAGAVLAFLAD